MSAVIFSVSFIVWVALLVAPKIAGYMRQTGINVVTRVMGLMLAAIAVEFISAISCISKRDCLVLFYFLSISYRISYRISHAPKHFMLK